MELVGPVRLAHHKKSYSSRESVIFRKWLLAIFSRDVDSHGVLSMYPTTRSVVAVFIMGTVRTDCLCAAPDRGAMNMHGPIRLQNVPTTHCLSATGGPLQKDGRWRKTNHNYIVTRSACSPRPGVGRVISTGSNHIISSRKKRSF
ncbi:hypothetical protein AAG570_004771 [Ranatra chinensis]|uniref:Uncharacterized protein n=1 Tax=Ranatra chinensis TaxID=642074 RepID=A0ABD0Y429_9HEMI